MTKHYRIPGPSNDPQTRYFVECAYTDGPMFRETPPIYTEADCVRDIIGDEHRDVTRIFAANDVDGTWREVTEDIARLISQTRADFYSDDALALCKRFSLPDPSELAGAEDEIERRGFWQDRSDYRARAGY